MLSETPHYPLMYVGRSSRRIAEQYLARLERLRDEGFDVHVLAADDGGFDILRRRGIHPRPLPVHYTLNLPGWLGAYAIMQGYFIEERPVLVHAFDAPMAWLATFAARQAETPVVFVTMTHHHFEGPLPPLNELVGRSMGAAYGVLASLTDRYIVTCEKDFQLLRSLGIAEPPCLTLATADVDAMDDEILHLYDQLLSRHFTE